MSSTFVTQGKRGELPASLLHGLDVSMVFGREVRQEGEDEVRGKCERIDAYFLTKSTVELERI